MCIRDRDHANGHGYKELEGRYKPSSDFAGNDRDEIKGHIKMKVIEALKAGGVKTVISGGCGWSEGSLPRFPLWREVDVYKRQVIFSALGISLITKAGLGTSPITSLAFVLTFIFPHTLGTFTMMVNSVMFIIQVILLGKTFQKIQLLQLPAARCV